jgi:hypothetical protein
MGAGLRGEDLSFDETKAGVSEVVPGKVFSGQAQVTRETERLSELSETSLLWA